MYRLAKFFKYAVLLCMFVPLQQALSQTAQVEADKEVCSTTTTINAVTPNGVWSTSGGATIVSPSSLSSAVNNLDQGINTFTYSVSGYTPANLIVTNNTIIASASEQSPDPCTNTSTINGSSTPAMPSGQWSLAFENEDVIIANTAANTTTVNNLPFGTTTLVWTVLNGSCSDTYELDITKDLPINSLGTDKSGCTNTFYIGASTPPSGGSGLWTNLPGSSVVFDNVTNPSVQITAQPGTSNVRWSITYNTCTSTKDFVIINNLPVPYAGKDTSICKDDIVLYANALQPGESGKWTVIGAQNEIFSNTSDPASAVSGIKQGTTTFEWTVTNSFCSATDLMQVTNNRPDVDAGTDNVICTSNYTLNANNPTPYTGTWTSDPPVTFNNVNQYNATISGMENNSYELIWTVENGYCTAADTVIITSDFVTISAGTDQTDCSSSFTLTGTAIPSGGSGYWTKTFGNGLITNSLATTTTVTGVGEISRIRWTIISGGCTYNDDIQLSNQLPSQATTNPDKTVCSYGTTITASPPVDQNETGAWTVENGGNAIIGSSNLFQTGVTNLDLGPNTFKWTISNQNCETVDYIIVTNNSITAYAGKDTSICATTINLNASLPSGTGYWTSSSPSVIISNSTDPATQVSNLSFGQNTFTWTRNDQGCSASDQVVITNNLPVNVYAGPDQVVCQDQADLNADNPPYGTGNWTIVSGYGDIANANLYQTEITNLQLGSNAFRWTVTYNSCSSFADVEISNQRIVMDAGPAATICNTNSATMAGTEPTGAQNGTWEVIGGNGVFTNASLYNTTVNGLLIGINTFKWTITDGVCTNSAEVIITNDTPDAAQVGTDQIICSNSTSIGAVNVTNGTGSWSVSSGSGIFENSLNNNTTVSAINLGPNTFTWTVTKNSCSRSADIIINNNSVSADITTSGGSLCSSSHSTTLEAIDPAPTGATGLWTKLSAGSGTIESPSNYETTISNLANGENRFRWTVQNADCSDFEEISIVNDFYTSSALTVGSSTICDNYIGIVGNPAPPSGIGKWTANQPAVVFDNSTSGNTYARELPVGVTNITWTIENNGCFASSNFDVRNNSLTVSAGADITGCLAIQTLNADVLTGSQTGYWVANNIAVHFDNSTDPTTTARNIPMGTSQLTWTITDNGCYASDDMILINNSFTVSTGVDKIKCGTTENLLGTAPAGNGSGLWTIVQGNGTIANPTSYATSVSEMLNGANTFRWTVNQNSCTASDEVTITNDLYLAIASDPPAVCIDEAILSAEQIPVGSGATGVWTTLYGGGIFDNASNHETSVSGLSLGSNRFRWTVTKGTCVSYKNVEVMNNRVVVSAGTDKSICENYTDLFGSMIAAEDNGLWTCNIAVVLISTPTKSNTFVTNLQRGVNEFTWTVNSKGCIGNNTVNVTNNDFDANAGPDQEIIVSNATMNAELPTGAAGDWTIVAGIGVFTNDKNPTTDITNIGFGYNTFRWTVNWNGCIKSDDVSVLYNVAEANAGSDQVSCNNYATLNANNPILGSGVWTVEGGTGTFANPAQHNTTVTNVSRGTNVYRWTVTAYEAVAFDEVSVTNNSFDISAGADIQTCDVSVQLNGEDPGSGIGNWYVIQGLGSFSNNYQSNATVTNMMAGTNRYVWSVTRNACNAKDTVVVIHYQPVTSAEAGADVMLCDENQYNLTANQAVEGTGVWTSSNASVTIDLPNSYNTVVRNLPEGPTTFYWTISNEHCQSVDEVVISSWVTAEITDNPNPLSLGAGENAQFMVSTTGSVESYQWQKDDTNLINGGKISGANSTELNIASITQDDAGFYKCIINGYCNQLESYAASLTVYATSIENINQSEIKLYPNPSNGMVNFDFGENANKVKSLTIYHLSGKKIFEKTNLNAEETFDLSNHEDGTYIVIINLTDKLLQSKLIIRK
jgi:hypothetical protein